MSTERIAILVMKKVKCIECQKLQYDICYDYTCNHFVLSKKEIYKNRLCKNFKRKEK